MLLYMDKLSGENNSQYAYRVMRHNIMTLNLAPGQTLDEGELTSVFGTSRTPIREAILRLREEHLVDVYSQSKTRVSLIDYKLVQDALLIRSALETAVLEKLCGNLDEKNRIYLFDNLNRQQFYVNNQEMRTTFFELDDNFHNLLFSAADCNMAWDLLKRASTHLDRIRYLHLFDATSADQIGRLYQDHQELLTILLENKPEDIAVTVKRHVTFRPSLIWERSGDEIAKLFTNIPPKCL